MSAAWDYTNAPSPLGDTGSYSNWTVSAGAGWWAYVPPPPKERRVVHHPSRLTVFRFDEDDELQFWHWSVWHYRDGVGQRTHVSTRWGSCTRWEDAIDGGLRALARQQQEAFR